MNENLNKVNLKNNYFVQTITNYFVRIRKVNQQMLLHSALNAANYRSFHGILKKTWFAFPTPRGGGRTTYSNWVFFVQAISTDRYINRRKLWVVSLKSPSSVSVEYGNKKIFFLILFSRASYPGLIFCEYWDCFALFHSHFPEVLSKI